jgi:hypothetical protein
MTAWCITFTWSRHLEMKNGFNHLTGAQNKQTPAAFALSPFAFGRIGVRREFCFKIGTWLGVVTDSEGKARYIVLLSKKVYTKATTVNTGSWRSLYAGA